MIAELIDGTVDLALTSISDLPIRRQVIDFNLPTWAWKFSAFYAKPAYMHNSLALLSPCAASAWYGLCGYFVVMGFALCSIEYILRTCSDARLAVIFTREDATLRGRIQYVQGAIHALFVTFINFTRSLPSKVFVSVGFLCKMPSDNVPLHTCNKILHLTGFGFGVLVNTIYGGSLLSYFSASTFSFSSFEQLADSSYSVLVVDSFLAHQKLMVTCTYQYFTCPNMHCAVTTSLLLWFQGSKVASVGKIYEKRDRNSAYASLPEAKHKVLRSSYVFITTNLAAYEELHDNFTAEEQCQVEEVGLPIDGQKLGTMVPKSSPYKRIIDFQ